MGDSMFKYLGGKRKIAYHYPMPKYNLVIEPFCGSAGYSLLWRHKQIWLNDCSPVIADVWSWIIEANHDDIYALPDIEVGERLSDLDLPRRWKRLLHFAMSEGLYGCSVEGKHHDKCQYPDPGRTREITKLKERLHFHCDHIKHWTITNLDYKRLPDVEATWFIDAPYQRHDEYQHKIKDYSKLAEWCKSRKGQVIVCEGDSADWLPFRFLCNHRGRYTGRYSELIWTN
jgi:site-specific DNA-adenine methylase